MRQGRAWSKWLLLDLHPPYALRKSRQNLPRLERKSWRGKRSWSWSLEEGGRGVCGLLISVLVIANVTRLPPGCPVLGPCWSQLVRGGWGFGWPLAGECWALGRCKHAGFKSPCRYLPAGNGASSPCVQGFAGADASQVLWGRRGPRWSLPPLPALGQDALPGPLEPPQSHPATPAIQPPAAERAQASQFCQQAPTGYPVGKTRLIY